MMLRKFVMYLRHTFKVAVATLAGNITIFDVKSATQVNTIEGRGDLGSGRLETDVVTAKKNAESK